jgi:glucosamine 6-phosphate synthetase-like amidotransferase/phosphosugar isomerase protein
VTYLDQEISRQSAVIRDTVKTTRLELANRHVLEVIGAPARAVITGCGDSLFAAQLMEAQAIERGVGTIQAIEALELSRYGFPLLDPQTIVLALSYGGETVRVCEAAIAAKSRGAHVVAISRDANGTLAEIADATISYPPFDERSNTRSLSFQAAVVVLRELLGGIGSLGLGSAGTESWDQLASWVGDTEMVARTAVPRFAERCEPGKVDELILVGAGPSLVAARYGAAKTYEAASVRARSVELEEFCHCEIFTVGEGTPVVLIAPKGQSSDRAGEVLEALARLGCITLVVSNVPTLATPSTVNVDLPIGMHERYTPVVAAPAFQVLGLVLALQRGEDADLVRNKQVNSPLIRRCASWDAEAYSLASTKQKE